MQLIVASIIVLVAIWLRSGFPNRIKWHKDGVSSSAMFNPGICDKLPRRFLRASSKKWQCRRECLLSSSALPQRLTGSRQSKLTSINIDLLVDLEEVCSIANEKLSFVNKIFCLS